MSDVIELLRDNKNYRYTWLAQVVSEIGDYFNNIAVFSLVMQTGGSGLVVSGVMLARAFPAALAGPAAGVALDRFDRRWIMIASDLARFVFALGFLFTIRQPRPWLLYTLSGLLMFASPFFTSGRSAILPTIAAKDQLHTANSMTQTTSWVTQTIGSILAGLTADWFGFHWAFILNSLSFLLSAMAIYCVRLDQGSFRANRSGAKLALVRPWHDYREGLAFMVSMPLILGITLVSAGWATGGGAAQILFTLFGEQVFHRGGSGVGGMWGFAGLGLCIGGVLGHWAGRIVDFRGYKRVIVVCYILHGAAYIAFTQMPVYWAALLMICLSRVGMAVSSVLNTGQLLRHTPDAFRGRVFATLESLRWTAMVFSMAAAGVASLHWSPRAIGLAAGVSSSLAAVYWAWADWTGRLPEPEAVHNSAQRGSCDGLPFRASESPDP